MYSAIKISGKKLYEYAREGKEVKVPPREIEIYNIKLLNINKGNCEIEFQVSCSKGTYIRVLCENISEKLETVGYMSELTRIEVDKFKIEEAITFEELEKIKENLDNHLIKMEDIFSSLPKIILNERKKELFLNGVMLTFDCKDGLYNIYDNKNNYLGTGIIKENLLKRDVII